MKLQDLKQKVRSAPGYVKAYWKTPPKNYFLSLREILAFTISQAGTYIYMTVSGYMTFASNYFCGHIMGISNMDFSIVAVVTNIISYIMMFQNPIGMLIYENHGQLSKKMKIFAHSVYAGQIVLGLCCYLIPSEPFEFIMKGLPQIVGNLLFIGGITSYINWFIRIKLSAKYGRLKPFLLLCGIPSAIIMSVIPFLPLENASYTNRLIILHFSMTLAAYFYNSFCGTSSLVTFISPNSQERQVLYSIVPIITGFFPSVINIFFPLLVASTGGYLSLNTYKVFVPIFCLVGVLFTLAIAFCKERVIEPPMEKRQKVSFWKGAKQVLKNKYLWIINIANTLGQWQGMIGNILQFWYIYSLRNPDLSGAAAAAIVVGMTAGNILCPFLTARFEKRSILIVFRTLILATVFGVLFAVKTQNLMLFLGCMFLRNTISPVVDGVSTGLGADIMVYHQWRFGERADSISGVFAWITNPINMVFALIVPSILKSVGYTSDWDVLFDSAILTNVFSVYTWASIVSIVLMTLPYFFYDLTREKYAKCIEELTERVRLVEQEDTPVTIIGGEEE